PTPWNGSPSRTDGTACVCTRGWRSNPASTPPGITATSSPASSPSVQPATGSRRDLHPGRPTRSGRQHDGEHGKNPTRQVDGLTYEPCSHLPLAPSSPPGSAW